MIPASIPASARASGEAIEESAQASRLHSTPQLRAVLSEQVRAVASALRVPMYLASAAMAIVTVLCILDFARGRGGVDFAPELSMIPGMVGAFLPIGIWKREERLDAGFFWLLPVDRRTHALIKVLAGWVCLMVAAIVFTAWLLALAAFTGGDILATQQLLMLPSDVVPAAGMMNRTALQALTWQPPVAFWFVPLTAATGMYALTSAFALGTRYPLRWMIGVVFSSLFASVIGAATQTDWLKLAPARVVQFVHEGRYGLDALMSARTESLKTAITLTGGEPAVVWRGLPSVADWVLATLLWWSIGLIALWAATSRHGEQRSTSGINAAD